MATDLPAGPDSPPIDELRCAEASLGVLMHVLHGLSDDDNAKQTPCREYDVASLTDHLMNSITTIGGAAGAEFPERNRDEPIERQILLAARPAVDAWHRRGLDGMVSIGPNEVPAATMASILSLEFLVHGWDYAAATGRELTAPDSLADYVLGLSRKIITPEGRASVGFDDPIDVPANASAMDRLLAFTGRRRVSP